MISKLVKWLSAKVRKMVVQRCCETCTTFSYDLGTCLDRGGPLCNYEIPREFRRTWHCKKWH